MNLQQLIQQYLAYQKSLGWRPRTHGGYIGAFGRFIGPKADIADVRLKQVQAFLVGNGPVTATWHTKYSTLRSFYRYATSRGHVAVAPLPTAIPRRPPTLVPYIYSRDELRRLLEAADVVRRPPQCRLEPITVRTVLLLLYGAGLRLQEAVNLDCADVDWKEAVLIIRQTKFLKTRLVPIGKTLVRALDRYARLRTRPTGPQFFTTRSGARVNKELIQDYFVVLRKYANVHRVDGAHYQPRLHDLRHTFAVHCLTSMYRQGSDVQELLPYLSTYLGHVRIQATQIYLTMTPELLHEAGNRFERYAGMEDCHE